MLSFERRTISPSSLIVWICPTLVDRTTAFPLISFLFGQKMYIKLNENYIEERKQVTENLYQN